MTNKKNAGVQIIRSSDKLNPTQRKSIGAGEYKPRPKEFNEALPRTANHAGKYVPEFKEYYRNDGHKHLKSKGTLC